MASVQILDEQLAQRLSELAARENRTVDEIVQAWLDQYTRREAALSAMDGMFDDDISDLSATVRETMSEYHRQRSERSG